MTQQSGTAFYGLLNNYPANQLTTTIMNSIQPQMKQYQTIPWNQNTAVAAPTAACSNRYFRPIIPQPGPQTWRPFYQTAPNFNHQCEQSAIGSNCFKPSITSMVPIHQEFGKQMAKAREQQPATSHSSKDVHSEDELHEMIHRQRELIGKLISVIVNDKLRTQDTPPRDSAPRIEKEADMFADVEKLFKFTDKLNNLQKEELNKASCQASIHSSNIESGKKRSRNVTNENKITRKRFRLEWNRPKHKQSSSRGAESSLNSSLNVSNQTLSTHTKSESAASDTLIDDIPVPTDVNINITQNGKRESSMSCDIHKRAVELMKPDDDDNRLYSLRLEFSRRLKSLEDDLEQNYFAEPSSPHQSSRDDGRKPVTTSADCDLSLKSLSANHQVQNEHKRKLVKRRRRVTWTARVRSLRSRKYRTSQRPTRCDHVTDATRRRVFEKIRRTRLLWDEMLDAKRFIVPDEANRPGNEQIMHDEGVHSCKSYSHVTTEEKKYGSTSLASSKVTGTDSQLPGNKPDPFFLITRFLGLKSQLTDDDATKSTNNTIAIDQEVHASSNNSGQDAIDDAIEKDNRDDISRSDIFSQGHASAISTNHNISFDSTLHDLVICEPEAIGEVIVVATGDSISSSNLETRSSPGLSRISTLDQSEIRCNQVIKNDNNGCKGGHVTVVEESGDCRNKSIVISDVRSLADSPHNKPLLQGFQPLNAGDLSPKSNKQICAEDNLDQLTTCNVDCDITNITATTETDTSKERHCDGIYHDSALIERHYGDAYDDSAMIEREKEQLRNSLIYCDIMATSLSRKKKQINVHCAKALHVSNNTAVVEWGLVPRKAMCKAREKIQTQLCNSKSLTEKTNEQEELSSPSRRKLSLRSHSFAACAGNSLKQEKNRSLFDGNSSESSSDITSPESLSLHVTSSKKLPSGDDEAQDSDVSTEEDLPPVTWLSFKTKSCPGDKLSTSLQ